MQFLQYSIGDSGHPLIPQGCRRESYAGAAESYGRRGQGTNFRHGAPLAHRRRHPPAVSGHGIRSGINIGNRSGSDHVLAEDQDASVQRAGLHGKPNRLPNVRMPSGASRGCPFDASTLGRAAPGRFDEGVCSAPNSWARNAFSFTPTQQVVIGAREKRHCLCGDRVFKSGSLIPDWGTRTCGSTELAWACSDSAAVLNSPQYAGRQYMIHHCCDQSRENEHYEWTACSTMGAAEVRH